MNSAPHIDIDLDAIAANYRAFADRLGVTVMPVVKAAGYGHGSAEVARAAISAGAPIVGVADAHEALALRAAGIETPILCWLQSPSTSWDALLDADLEIGISTFDGLARLGERTRERAPGDAPRVHLKLDTGLGRNGAREVDWRTFFAHAHELERGAGARVAGIFSHVAGAGDAADRAQISAFERGVRLAAEVGLAPDTRHLAATGAALRYPESRFDLVRLGIGLYGLSPFGPDEDPGIALQPALRLVAPVRRTGDGWETPVGSVDGLFPLSGRLPALVDEHGDRWQVTEVRERQTILVPEAAAAGGDRRIHVIGPKTTADAWANATGTINYEITTRLSARIPRRYGDGAAPPQPLDENTRTAPKRVATIDLDLLRDRLHAHADVDLSADAYGHGAAKLLPLVRAAGVGILVRSESDLARIRELGADAELSGEPDPASRTLYGFERGATALSLETELLSIKRVRAGQAVSYGYAWHSARDTTLGLVPLGYADAIPRSGFVRARVRIADTVVPVVGRVAMDQVVVDLGELETWPGVPVQVWGNGPNEPSLHDWARWTGLSQTALCATLGTRVERHYKGESQ